MDDTGVPTTGGDGGDGVLAVLYGMFTSFTEALDGFDRRLAAIEAALQAGPGETAERLRSIEAALSRSGEEPGGGAAGAAGIDAAVVAVGEALDGRVTALQGVVEAQAAELRRAVDALRVTLETHVEETSHSFGRRAGEAGRRLVTDLSQRARSRPGSGPPPAGD